MTQKEFEQCIEFLGKVPLFHLQLPRSERPRVARALKRIIWEEGDEIIKQGQVGSSFFLILKGTAGVIVDDGSGEPDERATLSAGDHWGGKSLTERRPNMATIVTKEQTITLMMSREDFERLGLNKKLRFPYRPAIYEGRGVKDKISVDARADETATHTHSNQELDFLCGALKSNPNLRALTFLDEQTLTDIAGKAQMKQVQKGTEITRLGDYGEDFFVISKGSFEVIPATVSTGSKERSSAEAMLARTTMIQRLVRKQHFMASMLQSKTFKKSARATSMMPIIRTSSKSTASKIGLRSTDDEVVTQIRKEQKRSAQDLTLLIPGSPGLQSFSQDCASPVYAENLCLGDRVERIGARSSHDKVGKVVSVDTGRKGEVVVVFNGNLEKMHCQVEHIRRVKEPAPMGVLKPGDSFGELSLLYNTRREATVRARENGVIYTIGRQKFKDCFSGATLHLDEYNELLNEVVMLQQLLNTERQEIARNAIGLEVFEPGQTVIVDGRVRALPHFYIIAKGSSIISKGGKELVCLTRGGHFGERAIMRNEEAAEADVKAGPDGMTCLAIAGETLKSLHLKFDDKVRDAYNNVPDVKLSIDEYYQYRLRAVNSDVTSQSTLDLRFEDLRSVCKLGGGGFGEVFLVRHESGKEYAMKKMSKGYVLQQRASRQIVSERDTLMNCDSPFIVKLYQTFKDEQYVYMMLEAATGGELYELLTEHPRVLLQDNPRGSASLFYVACISEALGHLHERCIAYRDLKLENVLLDKKGYLKLCDMGFARFVLGKTTTLLGTPQYLAPEMIDFPHSHDCSVDWWALGVVCFELLTLQSPWDNEGHDGSDIMAELLAIRRSHEAGPDVHLIPSQMMSTRDFVTRLLCPNPRRRLGAHNDVMEIREHAWPLAQDFDWSALVKRELRAPFLPRRCKAEQAAEDAKRVRAPDSTSSVGGVSSLSNESSKLFVECDEQDSEWAEGF